MLRHMKEKHEGEDVPFDMKIISSHQNDALGRQCGEAIWIKETDPSKRINNKEEYHQPGDVDIKYSNDHEVKERRKAKMASVQNLENQKVSIEIGKNKENEQRRITDFLWKISEKSVIMKKMKTLF